MKTCVKCGESKTPTEFYYNKNNADKLTGKCKDCYKKDVSANYRKNRDHYLEYEKNRRQREERKALKDIFRSKYEQRFPEKAAARILLKRAVETGKVQKLPCAVCGAKRVEGHHEDYTKPLEVEWLCNLHHRQRHGTSVI